MSLYAVALRFPFTQTKSPSLNHGKQPQSIIPPPPNFGVGTMHSGRQNSPGICQTQICPLDCQMVKSLFREHISTALESNGVELCTTPAEAWYCAWGCQACVRLLSHGNPFHEARNEQLLLLPEAVWNLVVWVATDDRRFVCATCFSTWRSHSVSLCGLPLRG